ncbi:hypothetical protein JCM30471_08310 [Desulfuromonas carbonis]
MTDRVDRYKTRKNILSELKESPQTIFAVDEALLRQMLLSKIDIESINAIESLQNRHYDFKFDVEVTSAEVKETLGAIEGRFDQEKFDGLVSSCKHTVLSNIIKPFGLARVLFQDVNGGNVTTIHNAKQGVYAKEEDKYSRAKYDKGTNSEGGKFAGAGKSSVGAEFTREQLDGQGSLTDGYTGKTELGKDTSPDHVVSCSEFHKNGGFMLSDERKADFATDKGNLVSTRRDINQSMNDHDKKEWMDNKAGGRDKTNAEHFDVDRERVEEKYAQGKEVAQKHAPTLTDKGKYYTKNIAETGVHEGLKMGFQQSLGLLLHEVVSAIFSEIQDIYRNGYSGGRPDDTFFRTLKDRLMRIVNRVLARWKDVVKSFGEGAISGFFSNLVTVVINMFVRTGKRAVRIIREGFFSLLKAIKMLVNPPEGMSSAQAAHEATKLIAAGLTIAGGVLIEQAIDNLIGKIPFLDQFADVLTSVVVGMATGLATVFIVYALDKLDLFGVNAIERHEQVLNELNGELDMAFERGELIIQEYGLA